MNNGKFYRNPDREKAKMWSTGECAKYYLCIGKFYTVCSCRDNGSCQHARWLTYLVLYIFKENEVFEFKCSTGLLFDIVRQICDFKAKVDNCDVNTGESQLIGLLFNGTAKRRPCRNRLRTITLFLEAALPKPLLNTPEPICPVNELACADGTCLNSDLFCDGHADCVDGSDEGWCG